MLTAISESFRHEQYVHALQVLSKLKQLNHTLILNLVPES